MSQSAKVWSRALVPVGVTIAATMVLFSVLEATKSARRLPPEVGFIPVESRALAVTSSIDGLWRNLGNHTARLSDPGPGSYWSNVNSSLRELSVRCLAMETVEDLSAAGLDPTRGLSFALIADRPDILLTIPIRDADRALQTFESLFIPAVPIQLSPTNLDVDVVKFLVTPKRVENAQLCFVPTGAPFNGSPRILGSGSEHEITTELSVNSNIELSLAPSGLGPVRLELSCRAILRDGTVLPCNCVIDYAESCEEPFERSPDVPTLQLLNDGYQNATGEATIWTNENEEFYMGFTDQRMVIASRAHFVRSAADRRQEREARFRGDNGLLGLVDLYNSGAQAGDAAVLGLIRGIEEPVAGVLPFSIAANTSRIRLRATLPLDTFGFDFLESLVAHSAAPPPGITTGPPIAALVNDPEIGSYLTLIDKIYTNWSKRVAEEFDAPEQSIESDDLAGLDMVSTDSVAPNCVPSDLSTSAPSIYDGLGNFAPLIKGLVAIDDLGPLEGYLLDLRDGVPEIVLVQRGLTPIRMNRLIDKTRERMKLARDIEVLCRARAEFWSGHGGPTFPVEPSNLLPYLGTEGGKLLERYTIQRDDIARLPYTSKYAFDIPAYRDKLGRFEIGYVPPPVSDLDLRYRFDPPDGGDLDTNALRDDVFRLAFARLADGGVAFGTDALTLNKFLPILTTPSTEVDPSAREKLMIEGNPEHIVTLGLLYPADNIRSLFTTGGFEVLDQYRSLRLSLRASEHFDGLALDAELAHD